MASSTPSQCSLAQESNASTLFECPSIVRSGSDLGTQQITNVDDAPPVKGYEGVDWSLPSLKGWVVPLTDRVHDSFVWRHGWRLCDPQGIEWFLCQRCHTGKKFHQPHRYRTDKQTTRAGEHMTEVHQINKHGPIPEQQWSHGKKSRNTITQLLGLPKNTDTAVTNRLIANFDVLAFRSLLVQWLIFDHIPFRKVESQRFRAMLAFVNPLCAGHLPVHSTITNWIAKAHNQFAGVITELLHTALSMIHFSFDLWTSNNSLSLVGIVAHFIDTSGKIWNFQLGFPPHHDCHSGRNIAETVGAIIGWWHLEKFIGYFTTDNASNNDTCMEWLGLEFGFDGVKRRVRCVGHIINLVAKAVMIGSSNKDLEVFEQEMELEAKEERQQLLLWRKRGPVGKLHNIVVFICRSPQRMEHFAKLQRKAVDDGHQFTDVVYRLVRDNDTRWNSLFAMIDRALLLRAALEDYTAYHSAKYHEYCRVYDLNYGHKKRKPRKKDPPEIVVDQLSNDDWHILQQYKLILRPLAAATIKLQGQVGRHGHMWEVLPVLQQLLEHFERMKEHYVSQESDELIALPTTAQEQPQEFHFKANINLAWAKINRYYELTDQSPVYVAAVVLHPRFNWSWAERHWSDRKDWIASAHQQLLALWKQYCDRPSPFTDEPSPKPSSPKRKKQKRRKNEDVDLFADFGYSSEEEQAPVADQWEEYVAIASDHTITDPYAYWWTKRFRWPQLTVLALDILTVAPMSDEPERKFSDTGLMVTDRRNCLLGDTINATMSLKSWMQADAIDWSAEPLLLDDDGSSSCAPTRRSSMCTSKTSMTLSGDDMSVLGTPSNPRNQSIFSDEE